MLSYFRRDTVAPMWTRARPSVLSLGIAVGLFAAHAGADPDADRARARAAYDRGAAAHQRGDHAAAARELALADSILPNPVTLRTAIESAILADDAVLAVELCDRADRAAGDAALAAAAARARARFAARVGRVRATCTPGCAITIDGQSIEAGRTIVVLPGDHTVVAARDGRREDRAVHVGAAGVTEVAFSAAPAPAATRPSPPSLGWFFASLGLTAIAGGVTIGLGADTAKRHDAFAGAGCSGPVHGDCEALAAAGRAAQVRTNALIGVTAGLAAATAAVAVVTLRARGADRAAFAIDPMPGGAAVALRVPLP